MYVCELAFLLVQYLPFTSPSLNFMKQRHTVLLKCTSVAQCILHNGVESKRLPTYQPVEGAISMCPIEYLHMQIEPCALHQLYACPERLSRSRGHYTIGLSLGVSSSITALIGRSSGDVASLQRSVSSLAVSQQVWCGICISVIDIWAENCSTL